MTVMASRAVIPAAETPGLKKSMIDFSRLAFATRAARSASINGLWATVGKTDASTETDTRVFPLGLENKRRTYTAAFVKRKVVRCLRVASAYVGLRQAPTSAIA